MAEEIKQILQELREQGLNTIDIEVDKIKYNMLTMDYNDFKEICTEETIEDFIRRIKPRDDNELAYLVGIHLGQILASRKESL